MRVVVSRVASEGRRIDAVLSGRAATDGHLLESQLPDGLPQQDHPRHDEQEDRRPDDGKAVPARSP
ncbi:conserved hypothetical protein [Ricinus communis]|uniref:Uncharacterized protein n=1 Tax=Ricinus communis TaxID=3988 RepID=B9TAE5_RICCO|nr:conserved hypothetical protein [Ricinus communis]